MSQFSQPSFQKPIQPTHQMAPKEQNGLGLTGFIISLVGLFLCGIPSLIGIIFSGLGMRKEPKGFAVAGLILGLLGLIELVAVGAFAFSAYRIAQTAGTEFQKFAVHAQLEAQASTIGEEWERTKTIPTLEEGTELLASEEDLFGNAMIYETDGTSFTLRSAGPDHTLQTEDDVVAGPYESAESAKTISFEDDDFEGFEEVFEEDMSSDD